MQINKITVKPIHIILAIVLIVVVVGAIYLLSGAAVPIVAAGDTIRVYYTGTLTNGTQFDSNVGKQTLNFTVGTGQLIAGFDQGVIGMKLNETRTITIPANQAYGPINPAMIIQLSIKRFGNQTVKVGTLVTQTTPNGQQIRGVVKAVNATNVTIDFNPPLAGQTLIFKITVVGIQKKH